MLNRKKNQGVYDQMVRKWKMEHFHFVACMDEGDCWMVRNFNLEITIYGCSAECRVQSGEWESLSVTFFFHGQ